MKTSITMMATKVSNAHLTDTQVTEFTTMLDMIRAFEETEPKYGLFLQKDRAAGSTFFPYNTFAVKIAAYMEYFRAFGITPGTRVLFPFETDEEVIFVFFALIGIGAIPFSVKPYSMGSVKDSYLAFLSNIAEQYRVKYILVSPSIKSLELKLTRLPIPKVDTQNKKKLDFAKVVPSDVAFVQFSSGSTSFPKGIPVRHSNIISQIKMIKNSANVTLDDITATWLPLYHDMGLIGAFLTPLYVRNNLYLSTPMNFLISSLDWLKNLSVKQVTSTVLPDFAISYLLRCFNSATPSDIKGINLEKLRIIYNGSEPINSDRLNKFINLLEPYGLKRSAIKPCYGMAEAVLMVSCSGLEASPRIYVAENGCKITSVGQLLPTFTVRLRTEDGHFCQEREIGEIELKGGTLVGEYFENDRPFYNSDGFFPTGDLGFIDQGELFITGRLNDRFKVNGQSYFSSDFEHAVESLPFVQPGKVAVIQFDEHIIALIEMKQASVLQRLFEHQQQISEVILKLIGIKVPTENVLFISPGQLEKTSSGKLRRRAIAEAYLKGQLRLAQIKNERLFVNDYEAVD